MQTNSRSSSQFIVFLSTVVAIGMFSLTACAPDNYETVQGQASVEVEYNIGGVQQIDYSRWEGDITCELPREGRENNTDKSITYTDGNMFTIRLSPVSDAAHARLPIVGVGGLQISLDQENPTLESLIGVESGTFYTSGGRNPAIYANGIKPYGKVTNLSVTCGGEVQ